MEVKRFICGDLQSNGYVINVKGENQSYAIDPGFDGGRFVDYVRGSELKLEGILLTHYHYDHIGGVGDILREIEVPVFLHERDKQLYSGNMKTLGIDEGQVFSLGGEEIICIHTPGHTPGGVCFYIPSSKQAFTGDTVFNVDLGRSDLEGGSEGDLVSSIREKINIWSDQVVIYPGHGDHCTMEYVRENNREYKDIVQRGWR